MVKTTTSIGKLGEEISTSYLKQKGFLILEKNFHSRFGEIDIIAKKDSTLVFVEVKARSSSVFGTPAESVTSQKLKKLIKTANYYCLLHKNSSEDIRFDVLEVFLPEERINHIENVTF